MVVVVVDYVDGLVVWLLGVYLELGKELDFIVDMVFFGVVFGVIYY